MTIEIYNRQGYEVVLSKIYGNSGVAEVDQSWYALVSIDHNHHVIHEGIAYQAGYLWGEGNNVSDNAAADFLIKVGANEAHFIYSIDAGGDADLFIYEAPTNTDVGTAVSSINKKRPAPNQALVTCYRDPTISATGTLLKEKFIPGGSTGHAGGGSGSFTKEKDLAPNTDYLIRVVNRAGTAQPISTNVEWYEGEEN